jgi:hypothetical protein
MQELEALAVYAAQNHLRGTSIQRNSLLKPLDIILEELDRCPEPDNLNELDLVRAGIKRFIFDHLDRIADARYKPGRKKQEQINHYVDLFFDEVLARAHHGNVNKLLNRERLIRSAYLFYFSEALPQSTKTLIGVDAPITDNTTKEDED